MEEEIRNQDKKEVKNPEPEKKDEEATPEKLNKELEKIGW